MGKLKEKVMENDISKALLSINDVLLALGNVPEVTGKGKPLPVTVRTLLLLL